jgi:hypothetical protein
MDNAKLIEKTRHSLLLTADVLPVNLCSLANTWVNSKEYNLAGALFNKAYTIAPDNDAVIESYLSFLCQQSKQREALDLLLHAHNEIHKSEARLNWLLTLSNLKATDDIDFPILLNLKNYCLESNIVIKEVAPAESLYLPKFSAFPAIHTDKFEGYYETRPVNVAEIPNAIVSSYSHAFFVGDNAIREEYSLLHRDELTLNDERDKLIRYIPQFRSPSKRGIANKRLIDEEVEGLVLNLMGSNASNYYHWLIEWIPRIMVLEEIKEPVSLLMSASSPQQFKQAVKEITGNRFNIIESKSEHCVKVKRMIHTNGWASVPCDVRADRRPHIQDIFIHPRVVSWLREGTKHIRKNKRNRKIYLRRSENLRRNFVNEIEVAKIIESYGFEMIVPEKLSFSEQVALFSEASVILGPTGAAFANIVFCSPGTHIIPITLGEGNFADYSLFSKLADVSDLKITHFLSNETAADHTYKWFSTFSIDVCELKKFLDNL